MAENKINPMSIVIQTNKLQTLLLQKNNDYGNSVEEQFKEYGYSSILIRIDDKIRRLKNLLADPEKQMVRLESVSDTFDDIAGYSTLGSILYSDEHEIVDGDIHRTDKELYKQYERLYSRINLIFNRYVSAIIGDHQMEIILKEIDGLIEKYVDEFSEDLEVDDWGRLQKHKKPKLYGKPKMPKEPVEIIDTTESEIQLPKPYSPLGDAVEQIFKIASDFGLTIDQVFEEAINLLSKNPINYGDETLDLTMRKSISLKDKILHLENAGIIDHGFIKHVFDVAHSELDKKHRKYMKNLAKENAKHHQDAPGGSSSASINVADTYDEWHAPKQQMDIEVKPEIKLNEFMKGATPYAAKSNKN